MQGCRHEAVIPGVALLSSHHWHQLEQVPRRGDAHDPLLMSPYNGESSLARRLILIRVTQSSGDHSTFLCRAYPSWIGSGVSCFTSSVCLHHSGVLPHLMNLNVLFPSDSMMYLPRSATLVENHSELTTTSNHVLPLPRPHQRPQPQRCRVAPWRCHVLTGRCMRQRRCLWLGRERGNRDTIPAWVSRLDGGRDPAPKQRRRCIR